MKNCIKCGELLSKNATFCPKCKTIQPKKNEPWKIVLIVLGVIVLIGVIGNIMSDENSLSSDNDTNEKQQNNKNENKKDYNQDEIVTYKDVKYSITKVEKTQGTNKYSKPKDGYEYVKVTVKIENNSDDKISYNALDWKMVNADGVEDAWGTYTLDDDVTLSSGNLDAGGKVEGVLVWEQKKSDNNLRLRYYHSIISDDYTFQFALNN